MSLHTQAETARHLVEEKHAHYLMIIKANQPSLPEAVTNALAGTDADFTGTSWTEEGKGHGRREKRSIRTVPAAGTAGRTPPGHAHPPRLLWSRSEWAVACPFPWRLAMRSMNGLSLPSSKSSGSIDARSPRRWRA